MTHSSWQVCMAGITYLYIDTIFGCYGYVDLFLPSALLSLYVWAWWSGYVLLWVSYMHVFYILVFVRVQSTLHLEGRSSNSIIIISIFLRQLVWQWFTCCSCACCLVRNQFKQLNRNAGLCVCLFNLFVCQKQPGQGPDRYLKIPFHE